MEVPATEKGSLGSQDGKAEELSAVLAFDSRCFLVMIVGTFPQPI